MMYGSLLENANCNKICAESLLRPAFCSSIHPSLSTTSAPSLFRHMATIHFGNQPDSCSKSGLSHDNPLILSPSFPAWRLLSFSPSVFMSLRPSFYLAAKAECFWSCCTGEYLKKAHYDPLSPQSFVFPPCACCQPGKLQTLQLCRLPDVSLSYVQLMCV